MARYINVRTEEGLETVAEYENAVDAKRDCREYNKSNDGYVYYVSSRCTKDWKKKEEESK